MLAGRDLVVAPAPALDVKFRRRRFPWREVVLPPSSTDKSPLGTPHADSAASIEWRCELSAAERMFHGGHQIGYVQLIAGTSYIEYARAALYSTRAACPFKIEKAKFHSFLCLDDHFYECRLRIMLNRATGSFAVAAQNDELQVWTTYAEMQAQPFMPRRYPRLDTASFQRGCNRYVVKEEFYGAIGNNYQGEFRTAEENWVRAGSEALSRIHFLHSDTPPHLRASAWLDACNHTNLLCTQPDPNAASCIGPEFAGVPAFAAGVDSYEILASDSMQTQDMWGLHTEGLSSVFNAQGKCVVIIQGGGAWQAEHRVARDAACAATYVPC